MDLFTAQEIREILGVSRATFYRYLTAGLPSHGHGRQRRFDADEIIAWLDSSTSQDKRQPA